MANRNNDEPIYITSDITLGALERGDYSYEYIYKKQMENGFFKPCKALSEVKVEGLQDFEKGGMLFTLLLTFFEPHAQMYYGESSRRRSKFMFGKSLELFLKYINDEKYPIFSQNQVNDFYSVARCGMLHNGMMDIKVMLTKYDSFPMFTVLTNGSIVVNPNKLLKGLEEYFEYYINLLKDHESLIYRNFIKMFKSMHNLN